MKILLLGLGNDILTDDAVGLKLVRAVRPRLVALTNVEVRETMEMGLALLDFIVGYRALVLVDSIQTGKAPPGHLHEFDGANLKMLPGPTPHFLGVGETLALGRKLGMAMPEGVKVFAVEVADPFTLGEEMTPALQAIFPHLADRIESAVRRMAGEPGAVK